jgi:hypothetical protein
MRLEPGSPAALLPVTGGRGVELPLAPGVAGDAHFSPCGAYRWILLRELAGAPPSAPTLMFICMHPGWARADVDDDIASKGWKFARAWGARRLLMANAMGWRASSPKHLLAVGDPCGPENHQRILDAVRRWRPHVVCAWGVPPHPRLRVHAARLEARLLRAGVVLRAMRLTKEGIPGHPLTMADAARSLVWKRPATPNPALQPEWELPE